MNASFDAILEPLRIAIQLETEGKRLFAEAARKVTGRHAQQTFEFLISEEDKHIARIQQFYDSIESSGGKDAPHLDEGEAQRNLDAFNTRMRQLKEDLRPTASDIEAYKFALKFENGAEEFYAAKMNETDNPHVKRFYRWLIGEEEMHAKLLESCLKFAEDPTGWFRENSANDDEQ